MKAFALLCALVSLSSATDFFTISTNQGYGSAVTACANAGGVIASLHSATEYEAAKATCSDLCGTTYGCGCWLGITDFVEAVWVNYDHTYQDYLMNSAGAPYTSIAPWYANEPNDSGNEDCAHIWQPQGYQINDIGCGSNYYPLCRVIDGNARKCEPGWDNAADGECSIPIECWGGSDNHLVNGAGGQNGGDDGQELMVVTNQASVGECDQLCRDTPSCKAYSWASYDGNDLVSGKACTLWDSVVPTTVYPTNQIMCSVCDKPLE